MTDSVEDVTRSGQAKHEDHFYLKADQFEFSEERRLKDLVKVLPEFIGFPLELHVEESIEKAVTYLGENEEDKKRKKVRMVISPKVEDVDEKIERGVEEENGESDGGVPRVGAPQQEQSPPAILGQGR